MSILEVVYVIHIESYHKCIMYCSSILKMISHSLSFCALFQYNFVQLSSIVFLKLLLLVYSKDRGVIVKEIRLAILSCKES